jgi:cytochrome c oxidase subunit II
MTTLACAGFATLAATAQAAEPINAGKSGTRITAENYDLHMLVLCGVLVTYCVVFGLMLYSVHKHRKAGGQDAAHFHPSPAVEVVWTVIPWIILLGMAWPATRIMVGVRDLSGADITIRATGMQWKWGYEYVKGVGEGISFHSNLYSPRRLAIDSSAAKGGDYRLEVDNPVVVPVNKRIRMVLDARDEIHSWHIPALGVKQFAVPGLVRETWFRARKTGTYRGLCDAEACGQGRACVLIVVNVVSDADYANWVDGKRRDQAAIAYRASEILAAGASIERGADAYVRN